MNIPIINPAPGDAHADRKQFDQLLQQNQARLKRYQDYESEYLRARNPQQQAVTSFDYDRITKRRPEKQRHAIPLPYIHAITQKHTYRIAGNLPDIICPRLGNDRVERFRSDTKEKIVYAAWRESKAQLQFASGAHHDSLLGASCYDVYFDLKSRLPKFRELHPGSVIVVPGIDDPHDFAKVYRFWRVSRASFEAAYPGVRVPDDKDADGWITLIEVSDRSTKRRMAGNVWLGEATLHEYGFAPYVVIPNLGPTEHLWGLSDYEFFKDVASYIEALNSRMADVGEAVGNGAMQDLGSGHDGDTIVSALRSGGVITMRKDAGGLKPVDPPQFGPWMDPHFQFVRGALNDLGFTPPAAWGDIGAASGSDRALQIAPQVELTSLKQIHFGAGLQRLNAMILKIVEQKSVGDIKLRGTHTRAWRKTPFAMVLKDATAEGAPLSPADAGPDEFDENGNPAQFPASPQELIDGDYDTEIEWKRQLDRDDANFVLSELNKFNQGAQSLYTTLEKFGHPDPEDEMRLIEAEAARMPWLRQGMVALLDQQIKAAADQQGGDPSAGSLTDASQVLGGGGGGVSGALTQDALAGALNGSANKGGRSPGGVPGAQYGAA